MCVKRFTTVTVTSNEILAVLRNKEGIKSAMWKKKREQEWPTESSF